MKTQSRSIHDRILRAIASASMLALAISGQALAQDDADEEEIEEITVTGTQIKGAQISDALAVSVIDSIEIEAMGVSSGDELFDRMPEMGQNTFNDAEMHSGGVNSVRGDIGAFNLRNMGTGNTLALLNGRRLVDTAGYQTEEIGGAFVPVSSANTNSLPVYGIDRVEVLRDGASAIYGADAVAGVVNTVLKKDLEGLNIRARYGDYENHPRSTHRLNIEWGNTFDNGTNVGVFFDYYHRDRIRASDDPKWADEDYSPFVPDEWVSEFDSNYSSNSAFPQMEFELISSSERNRLEDLYGGNVETLSSSGRRALGLWDGSSATSITDNDYEFTTFPDGDPRCHWTIVPGVICGAPDDAEGNYLHNKNLLRDVSSERDRYNLFVYVNHEFDSGMESFTELSWYQSESTLFADASYLSIGGSDLVIGPEYYFNPFGVCGSPNRIADDLGATVPCTGATLEIDNFRALEAPRISNTDNYVYRILQGFRGSAGDWDWESAVVASRAKRDNVTSNRISNSILQGMLMSPSPDTYNIFSGAAGDIEGLRPALIDVYRHDTSDLKMVDFKMTNAELFDMPAGPVGFLAGFEIREESFTDDRDPRLDGTIDYLSYEGVSFPFVSDVANSSPTSDNSGERNVKSLFTELAIPVFESLDVQLALRYENFSDVGDTTVGKFAFGWQPTDMFMLRGSWSEAFRAPNLITINEALVVRQNTRIDYLCDYVEFETGANLDTDCTPFTQRRARGSQLLVPEQSTNTSVGMVLNLTDGLTVTADYWTIEKEDSIGLFGENNHSVYDLLLRLRAGTSDCANTTFNPAMGRDEIDDDDIPFYLAAGVCPGGDVDYVEDTYTNLDTRTIEGYDVGVYYDAETDFGDFSFKLVGTFYEKYEQEGSSGIALEVQQALDSGELPDWINLRGYGDLLQREGNLKDKMHASVQWSKDNWGAYVSMLRNGKFYDADRAIVSDGETLNWWLPAMTTYNASFDYDFEALGGDTRVRLGINNLTNERAPICDCRFGYWSDVHNDYGRYWYVDVRVRLD